MATNVDDYIAKRKQFDEAEKEVMDRLKRYIPSVNRYKTRKEEYDMTLPVITPVYSDMPKGASEDCKGDRVADERWWRREELEQIRDALMAERADEWRELWRAVSDGNNA